MMLAKESAELSKRVASRLAAKFLVRAPEILPEIRWKFRDLWSLSDNSLCGLYLRFRFQSAAFSGFGGRNRIKGRTRIAQRNRGARCSKCDGSFAFLPDSLYKPSEVRVS